MVENTFLITLDPVDDPDRHQNPVDCSFALHPSPLQTDELKAFRQTNVPGQLLPCQAVTTRQNAYKTVSRKDNAPVISR